MSFSPIRPYSCTSCRGHKVGRLQAQVPQRIVVANCTDEPRATSQEANQKAKDSPIIKQNPVYGVLQTDDLKKAAGLENLKTVDEDDLPEEESSPYKAIAIWIGLAVAFGVGIGIFKNTADMSAYFAGYILEQSLSVDNLFVFILIFKYFKCPPPLQTKALKVGIISSAVLRLGMILIGAQLIEKFEPVLLVFAAILLYSSYNLLFSGDEEEEDLSENFIVKFVQRFITVPDYYVGDQLFATINGVRMATPLLLVLIVVELSDILFAVDSIPAVFGVTRDPFIVYTSNMFAILSLRSLYNLVADSMGNLKYLDKSVALVLGFIGLKMVADQFGFHIGTEQSLAVVALLIGGGIGASLIGKDDEDLVEQ